MQYWIFFVKKINDKENICVSYVWLGSLCLLSGLVQKSDYGHIYAEIQKILKGSQTFKQPCILENLEMTITAFIFNIMKVPYT